MEEMASANDSAVQAVPMFEAYVQDATFLRWLSIAAAVYLFVIYKTNWRMNIMPMLLVPYIGLNLPSVLFNIIRLFGISYSSIVTVGYSSALADDIPS
uniref:Uncharacterized protein n=1 Tax=Picea sitchensis TaxID=3332 RepID=D5A908_PICSI|nr:unknown [Picea sitchensis]